MTPPGRLECHGMWLKMVVRVIVCVVVQAIAVGRWSGTCRRWMGVQGAWRTTRTRPQGATGSWPYCSPCRRYGHHSHTHTTHTITPCHSLSITPSMSFEDGQWVKCLMDMRGMCAGEAQCVDWGLTGCCLCVWCQMEVVPVDVTSNTGEDLALRSQVRYHDPFSTIVYACLGEAWSSPSGRAGHLKSSWADDDVCGRSCARHSVVLACG